MKKKYKHKHRKLVQVDNQQPATDTSAFSTKKIPEYQPTMSSNLQIYADNDRLHRYLDGIIALLHKTHNDKHFPFKEELSKSYERCSVQFGCRQLIFANHPDVELVNKMIHCFRKESAELYGKSIYVPRNLFLCRILDLWNLRQKPPTCELKKCCNQISWLDPQGINPFYDRSIQMPFILTREFINKKIVYDKDFESHIIFVKIFRLTSDLFRELLSTFLTINGMEAAEYCYKMQLKEKFVKVVGDQWLVSSGIVDKDLQFLMAILPLENYKRQHKSKENAVLDLVFGHLTAILGFVFSSHGFLNSKSLNLNLVLQEKVELVKNSINVRTRSFSNGSIIKTTVTKEIWETKLKARKLIEPSSKSSSGTSYSSGLSASLWSAFDEILTDFKRLKVSTDLLVEEKNNDIFLNNFTNFRYNLRNFMWNHR